MRTGIKKNTMQVICELPLLFGVFYLASMNPSQLSTKHISAPSRDLPAREILAREDIFSIHFFLYDSTVVENRTYSPFRLSFEYYIDTNHLKIVQYYQGEYRWNISVYNLSKNQSWNYFEGKLTFGTVPDLNRAYETTVQGLLGSLLKPPIKYLRTERITDMLCDVFSDSSGREEEWVWPLHNLPIQRRRAGGSEVFQITTEQWRDLEINIAFPDSVFLPPRR
jgi:hypothetical protein